jgi:hypothetical protein
VKEILYGMPSEDYDQSKYVLGGQKTTPHLFFIFFNSVTVFEIKLFTSFLSSGFAFQLAITIFFISYEYYNTKKSSNLALDFYSISSQEIVS